MMMRTLSSVIAVPPQRVAIPGSYGWPVIGPLYDRLQYSWFQGPTTFFEKRMEKYNSTVFRTNVPPAFPFFGGVNPNMVAVLDVKSFSHLFDMELVEKRDTLVGDFRPSLSFTGGLRVCAYLDTSEPKHAQVKDFSLDILKRSSKTWVPSMLTSLDTMWDSIDSQISTNNGGGGSASYFFPLQQFLFSFLSRSLLGADTTAAPEIEKSGHIMIDKWLAFQLHPTISITSFQPLVEIFLHSFTYPFFLIKSDYNKLVDFVENEAKETLDRAQKDFNLTKEEAIHNLLFILGFNALGGFSLLLPKLLANLGNHKNIHEKLRKEVRETLGDDGDLSFDSIKRMDLVNSFVYETLRMSPPVPSQFARARKDFDLRSHDSVYEIRKGELLCGYQPIVMRDSRIFQNPDEFVFDRFSKERGGDELLKYLFWSNGPQSGGGEPSARNKQCAARDTVPITAAVFLAYLFRRYDEIEVSSGSITALEKAK